MDIDIHGDLPPYRFNVDILEDSFVEEDGHVAQFSVQISNLNQLLYGDEELEVSLSQQSAVVQNSNGQSVSTVQKKQRLPKKLSRSNSKQSISHCRGKKHCGGPREHHESYCHSIIRNWHPPKLPHVRP